MYSSWWNKVGISENCVTSKCLRSESHTLSTWPPRGEVQSISENNLIFHIMPFYVFYILFLEILLFTCNVSWISPDHRRHGSLYFYCTLAVTSFSHSPRALILFSAKILLFFSATIKVFHLAISFIHSYYGQNVYIPSKFTC